MKILAHRHLSLGILMKHQIQLECNSDKIGESSRGKDLPWKCSLYYLS